jgi:hypothetical protein
MLSVTLVSVILLTVVLLSVILLNVFANFFVNKSFLYMLHIGVYYEFL